jgi:hypothetical protein
MLAFYRPVPKLSILAANIVGRIAPSGKAKRPPDRPAA